MRNKKRSGKWIVVLFLAGIAIFCYPAFSGYWNSFHQTQAVTRYAEQTASAPPGTYESMLEAARAFNEKRLNNREDICEMTDAELGEYNALLNPTGSGMMGYIEIPSIGVLLPIYHGTSADVLQLGVGHLAWTSLPVGGEGTHTVLSGHRGLPSARLLTDMDKVQPGDRFRLCVLREVMTYEVDRIQTVVPEDTTELVVTPGEDYCSLVTCTPYALNTHRLLVRGHRVEENAAPPLTADARRIDPLFVAPFLAVPILLLLFVRYACFPAIGAERRRILRRFREGEGIEIGPPPPE